MRLARTCSRAVGSRATEINGAGSTNRSECPSCLLQLTGDEVSSRRALSEPLAPCVVVLHTKTDKGWTILVHQHLGEFEYQRVSGIQGQIHFAADDEVLLRIVLIDIVEERRAPKRVTRIQRSPEAVVKRIADVSFKTG